MSNEIKKKEVVYVYGYIYITTNLINNRIYIGQHKGDKLDPKYIGSGKILNQAVAKYGKENFKTEILFFCESKESLNSKEIETISMYKEMGFNLYNITSGGDGLDSETARELANERWSKTIEEERQLHMKKARDRYLELRRQNLIFEPICEECKAKHGHKKGCSKYKEKPLCDECKHNPHLKTCSKFVSWTHSEETIQKYKEIAKNRPKEHIIKISKTLTEKWATDKDFVESTICSECGGKSNNHKSSCSKAPFCKECGSNGHSHKKGCSKFIPAKEFTCPVCRQVIKNKGNLKQHLRARHPEYKLNK